MKQELALQQVLETICQLHLDNKQVSVANVRNKMIIAAPLPIITRAITAFKSDPDSYLDSYQKNADSQLTIIDESPTEPASNNNLSLSERVTELEHQVAELTKQLNKLIQHQAD